MYFRGLYYHVRTFIERNRGKFPMSVLYRDPTKVIYIHPDGTSTPRWEILEKINANGETL